VSVEAREVEEFSKRRFRESQTDAKADLEEAMPILEGLSSR
jgi:hypothetical protein